LRKVAFNVGVIFLQSCQPFQESVSYLPFSFAMARKKGVYTRLFGGFIRSIATRIPRRARIST